MLTADLAMSWQRGGRAGPRLIDTGDAAYRRVAADLARIVGEHRGRRRGELEAALDDYVGIGTDYKILRGLIKLLVDECRFETDAGVDPADVRRAVFLQARSRHPLAAAARAEVLAAAAEELGCAPAEVDERLYADLPANQRLVEHREPGDGELLDRYNLAQAQALLYRCVEMRLRVEPQEPARCRQLFQDIKAFRLIHTIRGRPEAGYEVRLSGPVSMFHRSQKYGIQMAVFLPALLLHGGWRMRAEIDLKEGRRAYYELDSGQEQLRSHYLSDRPPENPVAAKLLAGWDDPEWQARESREVIDLGEGAFVPDLTFERQGEKIYFEALGFWTPRSLGERLAEFARAGFTDFLLAASEEFRCSREAPRDLPPQVIVYKKSLAARELRGKLAHG